MRKSGRISKKTERYEVYTQTLDESDCDESDSDESVCSGLQTRGTSTVPTCELPQTDMSYTSSPDSTSTVIDDPITTTTITTTPTTTETGGVASSEQIVTFHVPRDAKIERVVRSAAEIEENRQAALARRQLRDAKESRKQQDNGKVDTTKAKAEAEVEEIDKHKEQLRKEKLIPTNSDKDARLEENVDGEGENLTINQELVTSVLNMFDDLDEILAENKEVEVEVGYPCSQCEKLSKRVKELEQGLDEEKKKYEESRIIIAAQEALLNS